MSKSVKGDNDTLNPFEQWAASKKRAVAPQKSASHSNESDGINVFEQGLKKKSGGNNGTTTTSPSSSNSELESASPITQNPEEDGLTPNYSFNPNENIVDKGKSIDNKSKSKEEDAQFPSPTELEKGNVFSTSFINTDDNGEHTVYEPNSNFENGFQPIPINTRKLPITPYQNTDSYVAALQKRVELGKTTEQDKAVIKENKRAEYYNNEDDDYLNTAAKEITPSFENFSTQFKTVDEKINAVTNLSKQIIDKFQSVNYRGEGDRKKDAELDENTSLKVKELFEIKNKLINEKQLTDIYPVYEQAVVSSDAGSSYFSRLKESLPKWTALDWLANKTIKGIYGQDNAPIIETKLKQMPTAFSVGMNKLKYTDPELFKRYTGYLLNGKEISESDVAGLTADGLKSLSDVSKYALANGKITPEEYGSQVKEFKKANQDNLLNNPETLYSVLSDGIANTADKFNQYKEAGSSPLEKETNLIFGHKWNYSDTEIDQYAKLVARDLGLDYNDVRVKTAIKKLQDNEGWMPFANSVAKSGYIRDVTKGVGGVLKGTYNFFDNRGKDDATIFAEGKSEANREIFNKRLKSIEEDPIKNALSSVMEGVGQFAAQAGIAYLGGQAIRGIGSVVSGEIATTAGQLVGNSAKIGQGLIKSKEALSTYITSYIQTYDSNLKTAMGYTSDDNIAKAIANGMSSLEGATEQFLSPLDIAKGIVKNVFSKKVMAEGIANVLTDGAITNKYAALNNLFKGLLQGAKQSSKVLVSEMGEEEVTALADYTANSILNPESQSFKNRDYANEVWQTAYQTGLSMVLPAILSGVGAYNVNTFSKGTLLIAGQNRQKMIDVLTKAKEDGELTQDQFNEKVSIVNTASVANSQIPTKDDGSQMNGNEKANYVYSRVAEGILTKKLKALKEEESRNGASDFEDPEITRIKKQIQTNVETRAKLLLSPATTPTPLSVPIEGLDENGVPIDKLKTANDEKNNSNQTNGNAQANPDGQANPTGNANQNGEVQGQNVNEEAGAVDNTAPVNQKPRRQKISDDDKLLTTLQSNTKVSDVEKNNDLQYFIDKAGEHPVNAIEKFGEEVAATLIARVPTEKLIENYKFIAKVDETSPAAVKLDEIIAEREKVSESQQTESEQNAADIADKRARELSQKNKNKSNESENNNNQSTNPEKLLEGIRETGNQDQGGQDGQQLREKEVGATWQSNIEALVHPETGLAAVTKKILDEQQPLKDAFLKRIGLTIGDYRKLDNDGKEKVQQQWVKSEEFNELQNKPQSSGKEAIPDVTPAEPSNSADAIEKRRQEELNAITEKQKESAVRSAKGTPINKDNLNSTKIGDKYNDGLKVIVKETDFAGNFDPKIADNEGQGYEVFDRIIEYGEMTDGKQSKAPVVRIKIFNNKADADAAFEAQSKNHNTQIGKLKQHDKINAKYDDELKDNEQKTKSNSAVAPLVKEGDGGNKASNPIEKSTDQTYADNAKQAFIDGKLKAFNISDGELSLNINGVRVIAGFKDNGNSEPFEQTKVKLNDAEKKELRQIEADRELGEEGTGDRKRDLAKRVFKRNLSESKNQAANPSKPDAPLVKSILNQDTDLKGNKKASWMRQNQLNSIPVSDFENQGHNNTISAAIENVKNGKLSQTRGNPDVEIDSNGNAVIIDGHHRVAESMLKGDTHIEAFVDNKFAIQKAIKEGLYEKAIADGNLTAKDAIQIIKSARLEVPKSILDLVKPDAPLVKEVGTVYTDSKGVEKVIVQINKDGSFLIKNNDSKGQNPTLGNEADLVSAPPKPDAPLVKENDGGNSVGGEVEVVAKKHFSDEAISKAKESENNNEGILINMPIDDFLSLNPKGDNADKRATVSKLAKEGTKFNEIPFLNFTHDGNGNAEVTGHEGRHRAMELKAQGETTIPVLIRNRAGGQGEVNINKESVSNAKNFNEDLNPNAEKFPTKLRGHLEQKNVVIDFPLKEQSIKEQPKAEQVKPNAPLVGKEVKQTTNEPIAEPATKPVQQNVSNTQGQGVKEAVQQNPKPVRQGEPKAASPLQLIPKVGDVVFDTKQKKQVTITKISKPAKGSALEKEPFVMDLKYPDGKRVINMPLGDRFIVGEKNDTAKVEKYDNGEIDAFVKNTSFKANNSNTHTYFNINENKQIRITKNVNKKTGVSNGYRVTLHSKSEDGITYNDYEINNLATSLQDAKKEAAKMYFNEIRKGVSETIDISDKPILDLRKPVSIENQIIDLQKRFDVFTKKNKKYFDKQGRVLDTMPLEVRKEGASLSAEMKLAQGKVNDGFAELSQQQKAESKEATKKLNEDFEKLQDELNKDYGFTDDEIMEAIIEQKIQVRTPFTKKEIEFANENMFVPKGFLYGEDGLQENEVKFVAPVKPVFNFMSANPMQQGKSLPVLEQRTKVNDVVKTTYEFIEGLEKGLEVGTSKIGSSKSDKGYTEKKVIGNWIINTKTEQDYYTYLENGGESYSDHLKKKKVYDDILATEKKKEKEISDKNFEKQRIINQKNEEDAKKSIIKNLIENGVQPYIDVTTSRFKQVIESLKKGKQSSSVKEEIESYEMYIEQAIRQANNNYKIATSLYKIENGEVVPKYSWKEGDKVLVDMSGMIETTIKSVNENTFGVNYKVEKREGIFNQYVGYDSIYPVGKVAENPTSLQNNQNEQSNEQATNAGAETRNTDGDEYGFNSSPAAESIVTGIEGKAESQDEIELTEVVKQADDIIEHNIIEIPKKKTITKKVVGKIAEIVGLKRANMKEQKDDFLAQLRRIEGLQFIHHNIPLVDQEDIKKRVTDGVITTPFYMNDIAPVLEKKGFEMNGENVIILVKDNGTFSFPARDVTTIIDIVSKKFPSTEKISNVLKLPPFRRSAKSQNYNIALNRGSVERSQQFVDAAKSNLDEATKVLEQAQKDNDQSTAKSASNLIEVFKDDLNYQNEVLKEAEGIDFEVENNTELKKIAAALEGYVSGRELLDAINKFNLPLSKENAEKVIFLKDIEKDYTTIDNAKIEIKKESDKIISDRQEKYGYQNKEGIRKPKNKSEEAELNKWDNKIKANNETLKYITANEKELNEISNPTTDKKGNIVTEVEPTLVNSGTDGKYGISGMKKSALTDQFLSIKEKYPDAILLFKVGDFYEIMGDDAKRFSDATGITLTQKDGSYLAGFPLASLDIHMTKAIKAGNRVAIIEEDVINNDKKPKTPLSVEVKPAQPKENLQDYGEKIGGAKKDLSQKKNEKGGDVLFSSKDAVSDFETTDKTPATVELLTKKYPDAVVVKSQSQLPAKVLKDAKAQGVKEIEGVLHNGKVYMVADNIPTMGRAEGVYRHEKIGHQGVISVLKDKLDTFVNQLIDNATEAQLRGINKLSQRLNGKNVGELNADQKNTLGQEYIAVAAEKPGSYTTTWEKIKAFVRSVLRDMGIKLSVSDNDIKVLLDRAAKFKKQQLSSTNFSGKNNLSLQKLANYANDIVTGKTVFKRFSQAEQRGFTEGGTIHVEASIILAANEGADGQSNTSNEEQENSIESYAKQKGVWVKNVNAKYGEHHKSGEEALVWANPQRKIVTKSQNTYQYGDLQRKLDSITLHNAKFPETALKVIGFGRNTEGDFQVIVEQPFIVANENGINDANNPIQVAKKKELIKQYMGNLGFENTEKNDYADNETLISDLHNGNVIITPQNNIAVIDPIMGLNTLNEGYGGTREIQGNDFSGITQSPLFSSKEMEDRLRIVREQRELQGQEPVILPKDLKAYADSIIDWVKEGNKDATSNDVIAELETEEGKEFTEAEKSDLYKYVNQKMAGNPGVEEIVPPPPPRPFTGDRSTATPLPTGSKLNDVDRGIINDVLNRYIDDKEFPILFEDNQQKIQLTAKTQSSGQDRSVLDGSYVEAHLSDLRAVSLASARIIEKGLGVNWKEKVILFFEETPHAGNIAQVSGLFNVINTGIFQEISNAKSGKELVKLKNLQARADAITYDTSRSASLALNQRRIYEDFAKGEAIKDILPTIILTPAQEATKQDVKKAIKKKFTDAELNKPKKKTKKTAPTTTNTGGIISKVKNVFKTNSAVSGSKTKNSAVKDELIKKGQQAHYETDIAGNVKNVSLEDKIREAIEALNGFKC